MGRKFTIKASKNTAFFDTLIKISLVAIVIVIFAAIAIIVPRSITINKIEGAFSNAFESLKYDSYADMHKHWQNISISNLERITEELEENEYIELYPDLINLISSKMSYEVTDAKRDGGKYKITVDLTYPDVSEICSIYSIQLVEKTHTNKYSDNWLTTNKLDKAMVSNLVGDINKIISKNKINYITDSVVFYGTKLGSGNWVFHPENNNYDILMGNLLTELRDSWKTPEFIADLDNYETFLKFKDATNNKKKVEQVYVGNTIRLTNFSSYVNSIGFLDSLNTTSGDIKPHEGYKFVKIEYVIKNISDSELKLGNTKEWKLIHSVPGTYNDYYYNTDMVEGENYSLPLDKSYYKDTPLYEINLKPGEWKSGSLVYEVDELVNYFLIYLYDENTGYYYVSFVEGQ